MKVKLPKSHGFRGLGIAVINQKPSLYFASLESKNICIAQSEDGIEFEKTKDEIAISPTLIAMRISPIFKDNIMFYEVADKNNVTVKVARSEDLINWSKGKKIPEGLGLGINTENFVYKDKHVFYFGGERLTVGFSENGDNWEFIPTNVSAPGKFEVDFTLKTDQGIFVLYHHYSPIYGERHLEVKAVCFDKNNPWQSIWETKNSLWNEPTIWENNEAKCLGCILFNGRVLSYWDVQNAGIFLVTYPFFGSTPAHEHDHYKLKKHAKNPILTPNPNNNWENEATFNAAAFYDNDKVYLIYRAIGYGYISVLGYADSSDGINFGNRLNDPIFAGNHHFDTKEPNATLESVKKYMSGGGFGGIEDPRVTLIEDRLFMVYVAFNGFDPPRLALTSILYKDFLNQRFLWEKPVLISPPGIVDKSGCILPEKINGKYVIFHRVYPNILIDFVDNLNFDGKTWLKGEYKISPRPTMWDSRKIGTGAPPIKTKDGWLMIYMAVNDRDDSKYRIGAMMLDLKDPTKVLYRTNHPIIEPTEHYENGLAKFGVVYPCGAVIKDGKLLVYYGGSDSVTCVAEANLDEFLDHMKNGSSPKLTPVNIK